MDEKAFSDYLRDLMDLEEALPMNRELSTIEEWDSLSCVAFLSFCASHAQKKVYLKDVKEAKTIRDLYNLIQE